MAEEAITLRLISQDLMSGNISKAIGKIDLLAKRGGIMGSVFQGVGQRMGMMLNPIGLVTSGIGTLTDVLGDAIGKASDWEEANSKVGVVFEQEAEAIRAFASTADTSLGLAETAALSATGAFGGLLRTLGQGQGATSEMSRVLVTLAADLASFNNADIEEVLVALRSGLVGESEPLRRFQVNLSAARVETFALANGLAKTRKEITDAIKVQARYGIILEDTTLAQGDFGRTADGLANSTRTLDAQLANISTTLGKQLLPLMVDLANGLKNDVIPAVYTTAEGFGNLLDIWGLWMAGVTGNVPEVTRLAEELAGVRDKAAAVAKALKDGALIASGVWSGAMKSLLQITEETMRDMPKFVSIAVVDMKAAIKSGKAGIIEQFRDLAWQTKHPFAQISYANWLKRKIEDATEKMTRAMQAGRPGLVAQYRGLIDSIRAELLKLPMYAHRAAAQTSSQLAPPGYYAEQAPGGGPRAPRAGARSPGFVYAPMYSTASPAEAQRFAQAVMPWLERERQRGGA